MKRFAAVSLCLLLLGCGDESPRRFQGYVEGEFVYVASSQAGRLDCLLVHRGDEVQAGASLFVLEATAEAAARQQAAQQLATAEAQLADLRSGKRPPEVEVIRAQLAQAAAEAGQAAEQRRRDEAQYAEAIVSRARLDESVARDLAAAARVRELRSQLEVARLPGREQQIVAQQAQVEAAGAALAQADWKLAEKSQRAHAAARVYDTLYREGEWVNAGSPVLRLLPPQNLKLRFFVAEPQLAALQLGQRVSVRCDGCAAGLQASVRYISGEAEYTPPLIYSEQTRDKLVFMVEAEPDVAQAASLHPGQPVTVTLP